MVWQHGGGEAPAETRGVITSSCAQSGGTTSLPSTLVPSPVPRGLGSGPATAPSRQGHCRWLHFPLELLDQLSVPQGLFTLHLPSFLLCEGKALF